MEIWQHLATPLNSNPSTKKPRRYAVSRASMGSKGRISIYLIFRVLSSEGDPMIRAYADLSRTFRPPLSKLFS